MSVLPWKIKTEAVTISDDNGNELPGVPRYGSLTLDEIEMIRGWQDNKSLSGLDTLEYAAFAICAFFRYRLNIPETVSDAEILTGPDGQKIPSSLLIAVFHFFMRDEAGVKQEPTEEDSTDESKKKLTGRKSSGSSKSTIQEAKSLEQKPLDESPSILLEEPSKLTSPSGLEPLSSVVAQ